MIAPGMAHLVFDLLAAAALTLHLAFILWVIFGALLTRGRRLLSGLHIASLLYSVVIQVGPWPCPLTIAEQYFQQQAGRTPYQQPFLTHYLDKLVYPDVPAHLLVAAACVVCLANLLVYLRRRRMRKPR